MTNESEAMGLCRKVLGRLIACRLAGLDEDKVDAELARVIATALEARDAELADLRREMSRLSGMQEVALIDQNRARVGIEYKSRAELLTHEVYVDDEGTAWTRPTAWAYRQVCLAKAERDARIAELEGALEDVCNPLRILQRHADEQGRQLNGMAYSIANNLAFVQQHARAILTKGNTHD